MNQDSHEKLSALMDDELSRHELSSALKKLGKDEEQLQRWDHWHLIGDVIRGEPTRLNAEGIAAEVSRQLQDDPAILAPQIERKKEAPQWIKPAVGSAVAASIAVMAVMIAPKFLGSSNESGALPIVAQNTQQISIPVSNREPTKLYAKQAGTYWNVVAPEVQEKLNSFLVNHQEYAPAANMTGMLPYATFVGYDSQR